MQWNFKKDFNYEEFVSETPYIYMSQKVDDFLKSFKASDDDEDGQVFCPLMPALPFNDTLFS